VIIFVLKDLLVVTLFTICVHIQYFFIHGRSRSDFFYSLKH